MIRNSRTSSAPRKEPRDLGKKNPGKTYLPRFLDSTDSETLKSSVERELADISMYMEQERQITSKIIPGSTFQGTWDACSDEYPKAEENSTWDVIVTCGITHEFDGKVWEAGHQLIYLATSGTYVQRKNPGTDGIKHLVELLQTEVDNAKALIEQNKVAIAETDFALSQLSIELKAAVADNTASIKRVDEVVVDLSQTVAANKLELEAAYKAGDGEVTNQTDAKLTIVNKTIADNKQAAAEATTALKADMDGQVAAINQSMSVVSGRVDGVDGEVKVLNAKWTVQADVNGYISGIEMVNDGRKSQFKILTDQFIVTDGASLLAPFRIENGLVAMNNAIVRGHIEAGSGTFNGTVNAAAGTFNGTVNAYDGIFNGDISGARGTFTGAISLQDQGGNVGMKLTNQNILIYDEYGRLRVRIGRL